MNSNSNSTVSAELGIQIFVSEQAIRPVPARLFYSREDPYAVRITFHTNLAQPVEWMFARDLLATGTEGRKGLGDVTFWPSAGSAAGGGFGDGGASGGVLNIALSSPFGKAHFEASAREISDFLRRTYQIVPAGQESEHIDVEAELNDLLRRAS
jgi:Streptomyces sporulation and cell division protein, SsgA